MCKRNDTFISFVDIDFVVKLHFLFVYYMTRKRVDDAISASRFTHLTWKPSGNEENMMSPMMKVEWWFWGYREKIVVKLKRRRIPGGANNPSFGDENVQKIQTSSSLIFNNKALVSLFLIESCNLNHFLYIRHCFGSFIPFVHNRKTHTHICIIRA